MIGSDTSEFGELISNEEVVVINHPYHIMMDEWICLDIFPKFKILIVFCSNSLITLDVCYEQYVTLFNTLSSVTIQNVYFEIISDVYNTISVI